MELLEKLLVDLHASIDSEDLRVDATNLVASIEAIAFSDMDTTDQEYSTTLLFQSSMPPSMMKFLADSSRTKDKEIVSAKKSALKFMALYCKIHAQHIERLGGIVFSELIDIFRKETSGEVKSCILLPIKNILRMFSSPGTRSNTELSSLQLELTFRVIIEELNQSSSKVSKGLRCEGLKTLGLLVSAFPSHESTCSSIASILALCEGVMRQNFNSNVKEVDFSAIAGAFSCLDRCLGNFEDRFANSAELWRCLLQAVMATTAADTSRYAACSKAARLISHHAELFQELIGLNAQQSHTLLQRMHRANKKAMSKHSAAAHNAVLKQISAFIVPKHDLSDAVDAVETVQKLYAEYMEVLERGNTKSNDSSGAEALQNQEPLIQVVQGLAAIAPAVVTLLAAGTITGTVTSTVQSVVEAARHYARYSEAMALSGNSEGPVTTSMTETAEAAEGVQAESGQEEIAVEGYGELPEKYRKVLFLTAITSFLSATSTHPHRERLSQQLNLSSSTVKFLEEYVVDAVVAFSRFWNKQQAVVSQTLCALAHALLRLTELESAERVVMGGAVALTGFMESLSSAMLLRTLSRRTSGETVNPAQARLSDYTGAADDRLLHSYLELWRELLHPQASQTKILLLQYFEPSYHDHFALRMFDLLLRQLLRLLDTLDLAYEQISVTSNTERILMPSNAADQDVLLNLVTFLEVLLPQMERVFPGRVAVWFPLLAEKVTPLAQRFPLLSALYRLLTCTMRTMDGSALAVTEHDADLHKTAPLRSLMLSLQHRAATSASEFQAELLDAVLMMVLSAPRSVLSLSDVIVSVKLALTSGVQVLLSVNLLIKQLLRDKAALLRFLPELLPLFDKYLSTGFSSSAGDGGDADRMFLKSATATNRLARAGKQRSNKMDLEGGFSGQESDRSYAEQVQAAVLQLLGRLGGENQQLLTAPHLTVQDALVWSELECIVFDMPFSSDTDAAMRSAEVDGSLRICLDSLLPRIIAICDAGSGSGATVDPQQLSAAAETLHALVLYMLGTASAVANNRHKLSKFSPLYERILPAVLRLAVADFVCAPLFEKLLFQIVRWFSGYQQVHEKDAQALLDALFNRLGAQGTQAAERDLCARALQESFVWAVRQTSKAEISRHPGSVDSIMERISVLITHPQETQRTAAVAVLRKIYAVLREETSLVRRYVLRVVHLLTKSMRLFESPAIQQDIMELLSRFEEMAVVTVVSKDDAADLLREVEARGHPLSLKHLVDDLFMGALTSDQRLHRRQCMRAFSALAPLLQQQSMRFNNSSAQAVQSAVRSYLQNKAIDSAAGTIASYAANVVEQLFAEAPTASLGRAQRLRRLCVWMDAYNWLIKMDFISATELFLASLDGGSSVAKKKRKAGDGDTAHMSHATLFDHVADALSGSVSGHQLEEECLYRTVLLLGNSLASAAQSSQQTTLLRFFEDSKALGTALYGQIAAALLPAEDTRADTAQILDVAFAVRLLLQQVGTALSQGQLPSTEGPGVVLGAAVRTYINTILDHLSSTQGVGVWYLQRLRSFFSVVRDSNLLVVVFGPDYARENRLFVSSLLHAVLLTAATDSATRATTNPIVFEQASAAFALATDMGLPFHTTTDGAVGLLEFLLMPDCGKLLLDHFRDQVIAVLLDHDATTTALSLHVPANLSAFLQAMGRIDAKKSSSNNAVQTLLPLILSAVIAQQHSAVENKAVLAKCVAFTNAIIQAVVAQPEVLDIWPDNVLLLLLEAATGQLQGAEVCVFRELMLRNCSDAFASAASSSGGDRSSLLISRLQWLPYLIEGTVESAPLPYSLTRTSDEAAKALLGEALDEMCAHCFPLDSHAFSSSSPEGRNYFKLFRAYLEAFAKTGSVLLLNPLLPSFREGSRHRYFNLVRRAMRTVTSSIAADPIDSSSMSQQAQLYLAVRIPASFCAKHLLDDFQDQAVKHILFQQLMVPTLLRCPVDAVVHIFAAIKAATQQLHPEMQFSFSDSQGADISVVKQLVDTLLKEPHTVLRKSGSDAAAALVYIQSCAYRLLEVLFDRCSLSVLKTEVTQAFMSTDAITGKELTQAVCRAAHKQLRAPKLPTDCVPSALATALYTAAFRCLAVTVAKTQTEEQFFDTFLFKEKPEEDVWERMVGDLVQDEEGNLVNPNIFRAVSGKFPTVALGRVGGEEDALPTQLKEQYYATRRRLQQALRCQTTSSVAVGGAGYLSQYMTDSVTGASTAAHLCQPGRGYTSQDTQPFSGEGGGASLSGDNYSVSQYHYGKDGTIAGVLGDSATYNASQMIGAGADEALQSPGVVLGLDDQVIYLELNDLNCAPAMGCLVRTLQRMEVLFRAKWEAAGTTELDMPKWLSEVKAKIADVTMTGQNVNVRLFLLRFLLNQPVSSIVSPWMEHLLPSVLTCALLDLCGLDVNAISTNNYLTRPFVPTAPTLGRKPGDCYGYVLRDLVFNICDVWKDTAIPSDSCTQQATLLLNYLLEHAFDADVDILRENILSIKALLSLWIPSARCTPPLQLRLYAMVDLMMTAHSSTGGAHAAASSRGSEGVRRRLSGLEIVQHLLLHCKYPLLEAVRSGSCCGSAILVAVVDGIKFPRKEVMESSCELAGVVLAAISGVQSQNKSATLVAECEKFQEKVQLAIEQRLSQKAGLDAVATCLRAVTFRYPSFLSRDLLMRTVYQLPRLSARSKYDYLEMLCRSASVASFEDVSLVNDLLAPHLLPCLADLSTVVFGRGRHAHRVPMIQVNTLLLLRKHVAELSVELIESLLGSSATEGVTLCVAAQSVVQVRDAAYEFLLALWHHRLSGPPIASGGWASASQQQSLRAKVCQLLLNGLRDRDTMGMGVELSNTVPFLDPIALVDISNVRYDSPKFWLDENLGRLGIRKKIFTFFEASARDHGYGLSDNFADRMHSLASHLFSPAQQQQWLQYSSFLTLAVSRRSSKFADLLFQHSLSDENSFTELAVGSRAQDVNARAGSALSAMTPLFSLERTSQTIASSMSESGSVASIANISAAQSYLASQEKLGTQSVDVLQRRAGFVRGTQQLSWTQTQNEALGAGTGAQQRSAGRTGSSALSRVGAVVDTSSTQFSALGRTVSATLALSQSSSQHANGAGIVTPALMGPPVGLPSRYVTTQRVPIRFSHRSDKTSATEVGEEGGGIVSRAAKYAAVAAMQSGKNMAERRKQQDRQSGGKGRVVVYRRYREGELPDIAIKLSDVMLPLQSLCLSDDVSAGLVYGALHDALLKAAMETEQTSKVDALGADLCAMLEKLRTAGAYSGNLCATILRRSSFSLKAYLAASRAPVALTAPTRGRGAKATSSTATTQPAAVFSVHLLLPAELVAECAMQSGNFHTGIQVLEEQLLVLQQAAPSVASAIAAENAETISSTQTSGNSRKRNLQSTLNADSDDDSASQVSTASAAKRTRKAPSRNSAAATISSQLSSDSARPARGGRRKADTATVPMDVSEMESTAPSAEPGVDEPTQQAEGLTADELLEQMSESTAGEKVRVNVRANKSAVKLTTTSSTGTGLTTEQALLLQKRRRSIWHQLYRLYDCLGERDVLLGLTVRLGDEEVSESANSSSSSDHARLTRQALDAELSGDYQEAVRIYSSMNEAVDRQLEEEGRRGGVSVVTQTERDLWDERTLRCLKQLCDWQQLYDCVGNVAQLSLEDAGQTEQRDRDLWDIMSGLNTCIPAGNRLKEVLLPHYLQSLQHLSCPYTDASETAVPTQERTRFIERVLAHQANKDLDKGHLYQLRKYVEQRFPIEVAVGVAGMGDWARARLFCDQAHTRFISQWSSLHPCATQARRQLLTQLQPVVELRDAADCAVRGTGGAEPDAEVLRLLVRNWNTAAPTINDDVSHWADVACGRHTAFQVLTRELGDNVGTATALMSLAELHVQTAAAAVHQGVLSVVKTQLEINNSIRRSVLGKKAVLTMAEVQVVYQYNSKSIARLLAGGSQQDSTAQVLGMLQKTMGLLDKKAELLRGGRLSAPSIADQRSGDSTSATDTLALMLLRADWQAKWALCLENTSGSDPFQGRDRLVSALQLYEQCSAGTAEALNMRSTDSPVMLLALQDKTATSFTQHCDLLLQRLERDDGPDRAALTQALVSATAIPACADSRAAAATLLVRCFVQGLRIGNAHSMQRVLRLVQVIGAYPAETEDILRAQLQHIPAWVFLQFSAQLMGCLDRPEGVVIATILEHTAAAYPSALYYPFRITSEFLGARGRERSACLSALLRNPAQDAFIEALGGLTHPEHRWNDGMKEIDAVLRNAASAIKLDEDTRMRVSAIYTALRRKTLETEWTSVAGKIGTYNRQWARKARTVADKIAGPVGEKLLSGGKKALDALREAINNADFSEVMLFAGGKVPLAEFSQWLCDFDPLQCSIEVPGQYASIAAAAGPGLYGGPAMHLHEAIVGVDPSLLVMTSIRKPKRIRLFGSAGGQHMFLVKGGEDLRNDERIQQLFQLMNVVVRTHAHSGAPDRAAGGCGEGLSARTYAVIPMTSQVGVLEWVSNTTPLKSILQEEMGRDVAFCAANPRAVSDAADSSISGAKEVDLMRLTAYEQRLRWVKSHDCRDYHRMFKTASRVQASELYDTITASIPSDFIRRRFLGLALTAEAFLTVRAEFAKSLAVSSLFGYLLGIGDRHLENLLVDLTTGAVIQIDFGICFGMGSSVLQVPELLPFRLTPQLRAVLQPLDGVGLLRHYMVQCLQALREDAAASHLTASSRSKASSASVPPETYSGIIPNALEVYLNDPVVDWLRGATAHKAGKPSSGASAATASSDASSAQEAIAASLREEWTERRADMHWEPRRRVHIAVQKLRGLEPVQALLLDLQMNAFVQREKSLFALKSIITGSAGTSAMASGHDASTVLSAGEQVDSLIRLATDPDILVRQWGGLQTWL